MKIKGLEMNAFSEAKISEDGEIILNKKMTKEIKRWGTTVKAFFEGNNLILVPAGKSLDSSYPIIVSYQNVFNGEPVIIGTRITVRTVVEYFRL